MDVTVQEWHDDDDLFASLKAAFREAESVPPRFVDAGRSAFTWYHIDAELADLFYDSSTAATGPVQAMRAHDASLRALTYATSEVTIEIEMTPDAVLGQVLPPQAGSAAIYVVAEPTATARVDDMGFFAIRPVPASAFRLRCTTDSGHDVMTGVITP